MSVQQLISSAGTCLKQVPAVFRFIRQYPGDPSWEPGTTNLDYGGGKYDLFTDELAELGVRNLIYDPYNRTQEHNHSVLYELNHSPADIATCSNVLNVIQEPAVRKDVISDILNLVKVGAYMVFTVYPGCRSSSGAITSKGWQANRPLRSYLSEIREFIPNAKISGVMIIGTKV